VNAKDMESAAVVLSTINKYRDEIKEKKESVTKPINEALKNIRSLFKPLEEKLDSSISLIRTEMTRYQTDEMKRVADEKSKIENRIGEGKGKIGFETAVKKIENIEKPEQNVNVSNGSVGFVKTRKFLVENVSLLPVEYVLPNEVLIRNAMKTGIELPGVRYYDEMVPRNTR